jgi:hypothetical protein
LRRASLLASQPHKHRVLVALDLGVLDNLNVFSISPCFLLPLSVSYLSPYEDEEGLASLNAICEDTDLESGFALVPATSQLLKLDGL